MEQVSAWLQEQKQQGNLSELERKTGISYHTLYRIARGERQPSFDTTRKLLNVLPREVKLEIVAIFLPEDSLVVEAGR